jgi:hypothetical protein
LLYSVLLFSIRIDVLLCKVVCAAASGDEDAPAIAVVKWLEIGVVESGLFWRCYPTDLIW